VKEAVTTDVSDQQPDLGSLAHQARWRVIETVTSNKAGHIGGPLSMMDQLYVATSASSTSDLKTIRPRREPSAGRHPRLQWLSSRYCLECFRVDRAGGESAERDSVARGWPARGGSVIDWDQQVISGID
jgi:hypothetical protein